MDPEDFAEPVVYRLCYGEAWRRAEMPQLTREPDRETLQARLVTELRAPHGECHQGLVAEAADDALGGRRLRW
jgi:hypothetical protein